MNNNDEHKKVELMDNSKVDMEKKESMVVVTDIIKMERTKKPVVSH